MKINEHGHHQIYFRFAFRQIICLSNINNKEKEEYKISSSIFDFNVILRIKELNQFSYFNSNSIEFQESIALRIKESEV